MSAASPASTCCTPNRSESVHVSRKEEREARRADLDRECCVGGSIADVARECDVKPEAVHKPMHSDNHRHSRAFGGRYGVLECEEVGVQR
jgi:hypothetical protein